MKNEIMPGSAENGEKRMSFIDHLEELRWRIIACIAVWAAGSVAGWYLSTDIISIFKAYPSLKDVQLILIRPAEAFTVRMKVAMITGVFIAMPVIIYEILAFILPGLKTGEKKWILRLVPASTILFYGGSAFFVATMLPFTLKLFLVDLAGGIAIPQISLEEYVNFLGALVFMGGIVFQTPIVILFLVMIGVLSSDILRKYRKHAVIAIFVIAAIASPPDIISQILVAIPMLILYEATIWISKAAGK